LEGEERRIELARMLAGMPESERGKEAIDELLALAGAG
jgi:DNA repair ATPase RecN